MIPIEKLFQDQLKDWPTVTKNYHDLKYIVCKEIDYDDFKIKIQYNPERIRSSAAPVDKQSLSKRPCILCSENRPEAQTGISYPPDYTILVNPYPIFSRHLTIPDKKHLPQLIKDRITAMLHLANDLPDYTLLYNGPKSGASAPDHFHFQAGRKGTLPIEHDFHFYPKKHKIKAGKKGNIYKMNRYLRECFIFESKEISWLKSEFEKFYLFLHKLQPGEEEPMFNIICWKENNTWLLVFFPRKQHRPRQYFEEGKQQILLSPGVVDFGGILVVPRKEDYDRLDKELVKDIYSQLTHIIDETA